MRVEERLDPGARVIRVELPGIGPDDVDVTVTGNRVRVRVDRRTETTSRGAAGRSSQVSHVAFSRSYLLPPGARPADVSTRFERDGVEVRLPR